MMKTTKLLGLAAALMMSSAACAAYADDVQPNTKGTWIIDARVSDVSPDTSAAITTAAGAPTGLHVHVTDDVMPTLGFTYFLTNKIAIEAILGTTQHTIDGVSAAGSSTKVHTTWVLPPVVALQYYPLPTARFSPYVGAGVNTMLYYAGKNYNGVTVGLTDSVGAAVQVGANYTIQGPWLANFDIKKVFVTTNASIDGGALKSSVDLNPWVFSIGIGRKF
jgi:outer membrane protein